MPARTPVAATAGKQYTPADTVPPPPTEQPAEPAAGATPMPAAPRTLESIAAQLAAPFPMELIELKPGATNREKTRGIAMPYADIRAYQNRLDAVAGIANWSVSYRPISERAVICTLTILGVAREDVGEAELEEPDRNGEMRPNPNVTTGAVAQAFKRACAAFGLGRYLYSLPEVWGDYDREKRRFVDPAALIGQLYREAGIDLSRRASLISRINVLLGGLDEEALVRVGKCAAGKPAPAVEPG